MSGPSIQKAFELALQRHQSGRFQEAEKLYQQILVRQPQHAGAIQYLGVIAYQTGRSELAVQLIRRAISLQPNYFQAYGNLGTVLNDLGKHDDAIAALRQAIALDPNFPDAHNNLGNALKAKGHLEEAIAAYRKAIALNPNYPEPHSNLGNALTEMGQYTEAISALRRAIALKGDFVDAHYNLGNALRENEQYDEAVAAYRQAILLKPNHPDAFGNLGNALKEMGQLNEAIAAFRKAVALKPDFAGVHGNLVYTLHFLPGCDAGMIAAEHQLWSRQHAEPLRKFIQAHFNDRSPERPLRIGYVSADFRDHVVGRNLLPLFRHHDREQFEIFCYAHVLRPDRITDEFRRNARGWCDIVRVSDTELANQIRRDRIDILVDLTLHMAGNRLLVFARKPAPVQVTFGGYPAGTGLDTMDYRLTDPHLDPPGQSDSLHREKSIRLPDSFWCYDPEAMEAPADAVGPPPAVLNGFITFGCLNNFCKVNDGVLELWAKVLRQVPRSRLILLGPRGSARQRVTDTLRRRDIAPDRLEWVDRQRRSDYLQVYRRIDLGLETFPYNGHTTSLDALWMGVPVVTLTGQTAVGRAGLSQLGNLGLSELVARTADEYVKIIIDLCADRPRLADLRRTLRQRILDSPLCDAARFARNIESCYRQIWRTWCETI